MKRSAMITWDQLRVAGVILVAVAILALAGYKLGWKPNVELREGLGRTIEYFRSIDMETFRAPTPNY